MPEGALTATSLRCERQVAPLGVSTRTPIFGWVPVAEARGETQTAYRVVVASDPGLLVGGTPDLWDSGRIASGGVTGVRYAGATLSSRQRCWWSVQLWDRAGAAGRLAEPAPFELGLLDPDDWSATWIGDRAPRTTPLLRREFDIPGRIRRARAYVTGLGYYELRLNGAKVGDRVLDPAQTTYDDIPDLGEVDGAPVRIRSPRVVYTVFDVTAELRPGANAMGLILGEGWYSPPADQHLARDWGDRPRGIVQLEVDLEDGGRVVVTSDETWTLAPGPIVFASQVHGEEHDARLELPGWDEAGSGVAAAGPAAVALQAPAGILTSAMMEPIRVVETLAPASAVELREGVRVVDFGQHVSGWTRIRVTAPAGGRVTLRHAGEVHTSGELDSRANLSGPDDGIELAPARQTDVYHSAGGTAEWEPRFTLHGFRYVEVTTTPGVEVERIEARVVHSDVPRVGEFECSDELLNRIDANLSWTLRASLQGYPQDAADRGERIGWLGDPGWMTEGYLYRFDSTAFWAKWLDDILDVQLPSGVVPVVVPVHWRDAYSAAPTMPDWPAMYPEVAWQVYRFSGDRTILERHHAGMRRLLDWFSGLAVDGVVSVGVGDHLEPQPDGRGTGAPLRSSIPLTSTAWWYRVADIVASSAELLDDVEAGRLRAFAESVRRSFTERFFDPASGRYGSGTQTELAVPLWFGLVHAEHRDHVAANLLARITGPDRSHLTTGGLGTAALEQVLVDVGGADAMFDIATQVDYPSWGDQIRRGATTVWEAWGGLCAVPADPEPLDMWVSRSMKVLAEGTKFLFRDVAGISAAAPGWERMLVRPALTHRLSHARARVATPRGDAAIAWQASPGRIEIELTVPATSVADVRIPAGAFRDPVLHDGHALVWADGDAREATEGISDLRRVDDELRLTAGGGAYRFVLAEKS